MPLPLPRPVPARPIRRSSPRHVRPPFLNQGDLLALQHLDPLFGATDFQPGDQRRDAVIQPPADRRRAVHHQPRQRIGEDLGGGAQRVLVLPQIDGKGHATAEIQAADRDRRRFFGIAVHHIGDDGRNHADPEQNRRRQHDQTRRNDQQEQRQHPTLFLPLPRHKPSPSARQKAKNRMMPATRTVDSRLDVMAATCRPDDSTMALRSAMVWRIFSISESASR